MSLFKKRSAKSYCFSVIDTTLASNNSSYFRKNLSERTKKLILTIDNKTNDEKLQYDINGDATKISALS